MIQQSQKRISVTKDRGTQEEASQGVVCGRQGEKGRINGGLGSWGCGALLLLNG